MKVKVLQGINLTNPITTIEIEFDSQPVTTLIDLVKSFHPLFMTQYTVDGNTVSIQSKLPHLWKEIAVALNKQAIGEWDEETTKDNILNIIIKGQVSSMSTIPIIHAAHNLGYETTRAILSEGVEIDPDGKPAPFNRYYTIGAGSESEVTVSAATSRNSVVSYKVQRDKVRTNQFLRRLGVSIANWEVVQSEEHLKELFESFPKPFVLKPGGLTGGKGVTTGINTIEQALEAYQNALKAVLRKERSDWQKAIIIQEQVEGEDYRLLVVDGKLEVATKRIPAYVVGDGKSTLREIIEETNRDPRRDLTNPTHTLKPIVLDDMLDIFLREQNLTLDHIPALGEEVQVRKVASMSQGGLTEDFTDKVHPQIRLVAESISPSMHADIVGIDLMVKDISKPLTIENGTIIEVNTSPEAFLNLFPATGTDRSYVAENIVKALMSEKKRSLKIVSVGSTVAEAMDIAKSIDPENTMKIGIASEGSLYINGELINQGMENWKTIESLKVNASIDVLILNYTESQQVKESGLGFDRIDLLYNHKDSLNGDEVAILNSYGLIGEIKNI